MKKSMQKLLAALLATVTLSAVCLSGCKEAQTTFPNFSDKTVEVTLGERYMLELAPIRGEDGNYYSVTATVKDGSGKEVKPFGSTVLIDSLQSYTVTYSVKNGNTVVKTVTVKLNVKNTSQPNILMEDIKSVYAVGENFKLPQVQVYDLSGESLTAKMQIFDAEDKELAYDTENGVFQCQKAGEYTLRITATNGGGITGERLFPFKAEEFNEKLFQASEKTVANIDNGRVLKNKVLTKAEIDALHLDGVYFGESALELEYINQTGYTLKGVNPWFSTTEIAKRKYFTVNFAFVKKEGVTLSEEDSAFCFHAGDAATGQMSNLLLGKNNGFGGAVVFADNGKYKFNTWYQFTLPAEKYAELLRSEGDVKLFGIYEYKLSTMPKDFRDNFKIIIGDIEVYDNKIYNSNGDNFVTEDYFS